MFADASTSDRTQDNPDHCDVSRPSLAGRYLSDCSPKDHPWDTHKATADRVAVIYASDAEFRRLGARVLDCSGFLVFARIVDQETGELSLKLRGAQFCRARHCPVCQWRRSMMWQAKFYQALPSVHEAYPRARWLFLTLTVKNCSVDDLRATLKVMNDAWNRLRLRSEFKPVVGWIRTTEVTRSTDGAHPHFHVLLMVKPSYFGKSYVTQSRWVELWQECAHLDYFPSVDVRAVKGDLSKAVQETLKYSVKPSDMEADREWFLELTRQLHKLRFVATGGILKDFLKPESEITNSDPVNLNQPEGQEIEDFGRLLFSWDRPVKRYCRVDRT